jgi:8-oxo-dGTP pyrophosphatase MutT (NUDIX family)
MDAGENAQETCVRETMEETGLQVKVTKLVGIYTSPDLVIEYKDGNRVQPVAMTFEAEVTGGELTLSDETTDYAYVSIDSLGAYDVMEHHLERIRDAVLGLPHAVMK